MSIFSDKGTRAKLTIIIYNDTARSSISMKTHATRIFVGIRTRKSPHLYLVIVQNICLAVLSLDEQVVAPDDIYYITAFSAQTTKHCKNVSSNSGYISLMISLAF
jgi:hypothetical protein